MEKGKKPNKEKVGQSKSSQSTPKIMEKGKKPNKEKVGQSELTPKIILTCRDPFTSFESASGAFNNGWNYRLQSIMYSDDNIVISRHNSERRSVLNHNEYKFTLKQWLEKKKKKKNNWDGEYGKWKVYRPNEEARQIIQGILHAVCELHSQRFSHGFLYHPENFAIQEKDIVIGGDHKKSKHVFLIHENHKLKNISGVPTSNNAQLGDRLEVSNVIFEQILGDTNEEWRYPQDLKNLRDLLEQTKDVSSKEWKLIANHPSLWHWKSRFDYPERVWMHYENANSKVYQDMTDEFSNISVSGWGKNTNIHYNFSPLWSVYYFNNNNNNYGDRALDLLRYLRNVRDHYRQHVSRNSLDGVFFNTKFVELKITEISELFLVDLYNIMCKKDIEI